MAEEASAPLTVTRSPKSALLVIDVQESFRADSESWAGHSNPGIQTEQCCETTARDAGDRGYQVDFVTDATLTFPIKHWSGGPDLPVQEIIRRTEYALAGRFAQIIQTNDLLASYSNQD